MIEGEQYQKLKEEAKKENFVYDKTSQLHDLSVFHDLIRQAFNQGDLIETRYCINTKPQKPSDVYYASSFTFDFVKKAFYHIENDMRRMNKSS